MYTLKTVLDSKNTMVVLLPNQLSLHTVYTMSTTMLKRDLGTGDLCDNIGLVAISAKWSYVTASPSHHDQAIPILSPLLFMHVGHPIFLYPLISYIPLCKIRIFDLLRVSHKASSCFVSFFSLLMESEAREDRLARDQVYCLLYMHARPLCKSFY